MGQQSLSIAEHVFRRLPLSIPCLSSLLSSSSSCKSSSSYSKSSLRSSHSQPFRISLFHPTVFNSLLITSLLSLLSSPCLADIYSGDRRDPYFTERPPVVNNYNQWGHYPILYHNPNRPIEDVNKYDPRYSAAVTPDTFNRYKIEDPGDLRCPEAVKEGLTEFVQVSTAYGTVEGRIVYLCDEPGVPEHERPRPAQYRPGGSPHAYRPITYFRRNVTAFLGIPYAKPPTRENGLRFKRPQIPDKWGSMRATRFKSACPQYKRYVHEDYGIPSIDEDCLYMNIYTPWAATPTRSLYPVMMYIHGGFFDHGSGNIFPGHMMAATQEVIVVTFNYRLGLLGFLATSDNSSAGNYGLLDMGQAINFVVENIRNFNGDPDRITLFGPDAGGAAAGMLALSPLTRRHVKRVIAQSGAAVADWAFQKDSLYMRNNSVLAGRAYGCSTRDTQILVKCLKSRSQTDFTTTEVKPEVGWLTWTPVMDKYTRNWGAQFMDDSPEEMLARKTVKFDMDFAYMSGITRDEGAQNLFSDEELKKREFVIKQADFDKQLKEYVKYYNYTYDQPGLMNAVNFMYSPWDRENQTALRQGMIDMITDSWYTAANDKMVKLMLNNSVRTYMYVLNYTLEGLNLPSWVGVPHDAEYLFASGAPFMDPRFYPAGLNLKLAKWTDADRNMSQLIMEAWANFAKKPVCKLATQPWNCGPTPYALFNTILWKPMTLNNLQYLSMNTTNYTTNMQYTTAYESRNFDAITNPHSTSVMWRDYKPKVSQFWNSYIPKLVGRIPPIWTPTIEPYWDELRVYKAATWSVMAALIVLLCLTMICSCLYCRAKSYRYGDAAMEEYMSVPVIQHSAFASPSTRANSELNLSTSGPIRYRNGDMRMERTRNGRSLEKLYPTSTMDSRGTIERHTLDRHTEV